MKLFGSSGKPGIRTSEHTINLNIIEPNLMNLVIVIVLPSLFFDHIYDTYQSCRAIFACSFLPRNISVEEGRGSKKL